VADEKTARRILPIELSSVVTSLVLVARELTKKLSRDEATAVVSELCEQLRALRMRSAVRTGRSRGSGRRQLRCCGNSVCSAFVLL